MTNQSPAVDAVRPDDAFERALRLVYAYAEECVADGHVSTFTEGHVRMVNAITAIERESLAALHPQPAPAVAVEASWHKDCITLTALQLRHALDFAAPDFDTDEDQRETQVSIAWAPHGATHTDEGDPDPAGYKVWMTDYPEEGSIPLDEAPAGFPVKSAERGRAIEALAARSAPAVSEKVPLTEEQILAGWGHKDAIAAASASRDGSAKRGLERQLEVFTAGVRFAERAHGIGSGSAQEGQANG